MNEVEQVIDKLREVQEVTKPDIKYYESLVRTYRAYQKILKNERAAKNAVHQDSRPIGV